MGRPDRKQAALEQSAGAEDDLDLYMADMKKDNAAAERRKLLLRIIELQKVCLAHDLSRVDATAEANSTTRRASLVVLRY